MPERPRRTDREIRAEIKALEEERRMLKTERSPARLPAPPTPDEIVVKRDYKGIFTQLPTQFNTEIDMLTRLYRPKPSTASRNDGKFDLKGSNV